MVGCAGIHLMVGCAGIPPPEGPRTKPRGPSASRHVGTPAGGGAGAAVLSPCGKHPVSCVTATLVRSAPMSDPQAPGEPVEEPAAVDDVVGQANEGLADAEAARRDAVAEPEVVSEEAVVEPDAAPEAVAADAPVADDTPWYERDDVPMDDDAATEIVEPAAVPVAEPATVVAEPVAEPAAAPVVEQTEVLAPTVIAPAATAGTFAQQPQPIFVQAPEPPRPRGNRAATGAIGLIAALCFAVLYLATALVVNL